MNSRQLLIEFKQNLTEFLDELIEQFPHEADLVIARIYIKDRVSPEFLMSNFIQDILPLKDMIIEHDDSFFLDNNCTLFNDVDKNKINHFKVLWKSNLLDSEDRQVMWKWFEMFIKIAEKYQKSL